MHEIWELSGFNTSLLRNPLTSIRDLNTPILSPFLTWQELFPFIIWNIWTNRNKNNIDNTSHKFSLGSSIKLATEYKLLTQKEILSAPIHAINVAWNQPHNGFLNLNTNGAFREKENLARLGGTIRDTNGHWILGFQHQCLASSTLQSELEALKEGINFALRKGLTPLVI